VSADEITAELREFIVHTFPSVPHLEALLLLRREPRVQTVETMSARLYIDARAAARVLDDLVETGVAAREAADARTVYRYAPRSEAQARLVEQLDGVYAHALLAVTRLIHERSAQLFADAFRFRKEKE
jgi:predicted transcriptional regulator